MRGILAVGAAVAATALVGQVAMATLSVSIVQVPISSQAKAKDGALNNARTYDVDVTQTGEQFAVADLQFSLGTGAGITGSFYAPTNHSDTPIGVSSLSMGTGSLAANLAYDTYFTTPQYGTTGGTLETDGSQSAVTIAGGSDYPVSPAPASAITAANSTNTINISWGDYKAALAAVPSTGTYPIAQITVVGNDGAFLNGYVEGTVTSTPVIFHDLYMPLAGDTNGDGQVGLSDLNTVEGHVGTSGGLAQGDLDADGIIGLSDLNLVEGNVGISITPSSGVSLGTLVPEPTSLLLLGIGSAFGLVRRSRRASI